MAGSGFISRSVQLRAWSGKRPMIAGNCRFTKSQCSQLVFERTPIRRPALVKLFATILRRVRLDLVPGQTIAPEPGITLRPRGSIYMRVVPEPVPA